MSDKAPVSFKRRVYEILEEGEYHDTLSRIVDWIIMTLILLNVLAVILESVDSIQVQYAALFNTFEFFSVMFFSVEYALRVWSITEHKRYSHPIGGRLRFMFSFMSIIDLLAVLPFYLPMVVALDNRMLRALRMLRVFRLLKFSRYSNAIKLIGRVLRSTREELVISLGLVLILLVIVSCFMYFIENEAQPDAFSSIPATMWWGVATLTTVGYGDIYPITPLGKLLAGAMAILGVGLFALPAGILANGFGEEMKRQKEVKEAQQRRRRESKTHNSTTDKSGNDEAPLQGQSDAEQNTTD